MSTAALLPLPKEKYLAAGTPRLWHWPPRTGYNGLTRCGLEITRETTHPLPDRQPCLVCFPPDRYEVTP